MILWITNMVMYVYNNKVIVYNQFIYQANSPIIVIITPSFLGS